MVSRLQCREVKSILKISQKFLEKEYAVLVTSSTILSANYVKKNFSNKVIHQFLPLDFHFSIKKFLFNYKPDIAVIVESEIWPNLIINCRKYKIPIALIQASFSNKSLKMEFFSKVFLEVYWRVLIL